MKLFLGVWALAVLTLSTADQTVDFVIVGGGTVGPILANRLSEIPNWNVLMIETGDTPNPELFIPLNVNRVPRDCTNSVPIMSMPSGDSCLAMANQQCALSLGKGLGGKSMFSDMIYSRGQARDFDQWARAGSRDWSWSRVLKYFKKLENNMVPGAFHPGTTGPVFITQPASFSDIAKAFMMAGAEMGYPNIINNGGNQTGFSYVQVLIKDGLRESGASVYLDPLLNQQGRSLVKTARPNLQVMTNTVVSKLLFSEDGETVTGVEISNYGFKSKVFARREVILASGGIISSQLLMLSGIGPAHDLQGLGIPVRANLPVGENFMSSLAVAGLTFTSNSKVLDLNAAFTPENVELFKQTKMGPLASPGGIEAVAFAHADSNTTHPGHTHMGATPNFQLKLMSGSMLSQPELINHYSFNASIINAYLDPIRNRSMDAFTILPVLVRPKSRGRVRLRSTNVADMPIVETNFFSQRSDIHTLIEAIKFTLELVKKPAFQAIGAKFYDRPLAQCSQFVPNSDLYWECYIRHFAVNLGAQAGTSKMGPECDHKAVVDPRLRVHGLYGLRVIGSAVMPTLVTGEVTGTSMMIGEKGADLIKQDWLNNPYCKA